MLFRSRDRKFWKILFEIAEFEIGTPKYESFVSLGVEVVFVGVEVVFVFVEVVLVGVV